MQKWKKLPTFANTPNFASNDTMLVVVVVWNKNKNNAMKLTSSEKLERSSSVSSYSKLKNPIKRANYISKETYLI